jgi:uncharacterized OB-fold protein
MSEPVKSIRTPLHLEYHYTAGRASSRFLRGVAQGRCAHILLDGADIPFFHVLQNCPLDDVRMGMRVRAVWAPREELEPTMRSIRYFEPIDEPDADYDSYKEHL